MQVFLLTPGKVKHSFSAEAEAEYASRLKKLCDFSIIQVLEAKVTKSVSEEVGKKRESENLIKKIPPDATLVALDENGKEFTPVQFSRFIAAKELDTKPLCFVIGGTNGLHADLLQKADTRMSLGKMTLTQDLARVVLLEAIFRGFAILRGLPFHR